MAKLLFDWLNKDVGLSRHVSSFEEDFRDGYLFGEILFKYNQQTDFEKFNSRTTPDAKMINFCLVEPTMRRVGLSFNSKVAFEIMNGKAGVSKNLLYEMKMALDRISKRSMPVGGGEAPSKIIRVVKPSRPPYDKSMTTTFENAVRATIENPNDLMMEKTLQKYKDKKTESRQSASFVHSQTLNTLADEVLVKRSIDRQRKQHEVEFVEAWNSVNIEQWKVNNKVAHERIQSYRTFDAKQTAKKEARTQLAFTIARDFTLKSIDDFDKHIENDIIPEDPEINKTVGMALKKTVVGPPGSGLPTLTYIDESYLEKGLVSAQKLMKEQREHGLKLQQSHDRRRKKFVRERDSLQSANVHRCSETETVAQLLNICKAEMEQDQAMKEVLAHKDIFTENRQNRNALITKLDLEAEASRGAWRAEQFRREQTWAVGAAADSLEERALRLRSATSSASRQQSIEVANGIVDALLDVADWVVSCRDFGLFGYPVSQTLLPESLWNDVRGMFVSGIEIAQALPFSSPSNISASLPHSLSARPRIVDSQWLFSGTLAADTVLVIPQCSVLVEPSEKIGADRSATEHRKDSIISDFLTGQDCDEFFKVVSDVSVTGYDGAFAAEAEGAVSGGGLIKQSKPPRWVLETPPKYLLGTMVVASRCVADPIPPEPSLESPIPMFPCRVVICGTSNLARETVTAKLLAEIPGVRVIRVNELVRAAVALATTVAANPETELPDGMSVESKALALETLDCLQKGSAVSDATNTSLIVQAIRALPEGSPGFILEGFPNTRSQASLLVEGLSGINFEKRKPQPSDRSTAFAPAMPTDEEVFDTEKTGLDFVFCLESTDSNSILQQRVRSRQDMRTMAIVQLGEETSENLDFMQELFTPTRPLQISSIALTVLESNVAPMKEFFSKIKVLDSLSIEDFASNDEIANYVLDKIRSKEKEKVQADFSEVAVASTEGGDNPSEPPTASGGAVVSSSAGSKSVNDLPILLARAMSSYWAIVEEQSASVGRQFFNAIRDQRYQVIQRRRSIHDVLNILIVRRDGRQNMLEDFRAHFNEIENDFRYDQDCIAELHLRTLELWDSLWSLCDQRRQELEKYLKDMESDSVVLVAAHRMRCEGVALLQSEYSRFIASVNVLFDFSKAVAGYDNSKLANNALEETLPIPAALESNKGEGQAAKPKPKDVKPAKGKDAAPVISIHREPVAAVLLPFDRMMALPEFAAAGGEEVDKAKSKAPVDKAKGKKGEEAPLTNPFDAMEKAIFDALVSWSKGTFTVNRALYGDDNQLCRAVEMAIWHEAERLRATVTEVRRIIEIQCAFLVEMETSLFEHMRQLVVRRHIDEVSTCERIVAMIGTAVDSFEPIKEEWLAAPDAVSVMQNRLVFPAPPARIIPQINEFFDDRMNDEQAANLAQWMESLRLGSALLEQDVHALLDRGLSLAGPLGNIANATHTTSGEVRNVLRHVSFPKMWSAGEGFSSEESMRLLLTPHIKLPGNDERAGVVPLNSVVSHLTAPDIASKLQGV